MSLRNTFLAISGCALVGMLMGGLFGYASGKITPDFFRHLIPWQDVEPVGFASFLGATTGVLLGGGLGCFAALLQFLLLWKRRAPPLPTTSDATPNH